MGYLTLSPGKPLPSHIVDTFMESKVKSYEPSGPLLPELIPVSVV